MYDMANISKRKAMELKRWLVVENMWVLFMINTFGAESIIRCTGVIPARRVRSKKFRVETLIFNYSAWWTKMNSSK